MIGETFGFWQVLLDTGKKTKSREKKYRCRCKCGTERVVSAKILRKKSKPRSCGCIRKENAENHFHSKYEKTNGCWDWKGILNSGGYGKFRGLNASRAAWQYAHGKIRKGIQVCHTCDNRKCVNPSHLFLGSIKMNQKDKVQKNRQAKGSKIGSAIMTEEMVLKIRTMRLSGKTYDEIVAHTGIGWDTIRAACKNKTWKHVALGKECSQMDQIRIYAKGEQSGHARLNEDQVLQIRKEYTGSKDFPIMAAKYGVKEATIRDVVNLKTWKHLLTQK